MKPFLRVVFGAGLLAAIPLMSDAVVAATASIGYVTNEYGEVVRTDNPVSGISECWHTERWEKASEAERQSMAIEGCDKVAEVVKERARPLPLPPEPPEPVIETREMHETLSDDSDGGGALFEFNKAVLTRRSRSRLNDLADRMRSFNTVDSVVITGHSDYLGSESYNMRLSQRRAESIRDYLVDRQAVEADRVEVVARGEEDPVKECPKMKSKKRLVACLAPNRRVVIDVNGTSARQ